MFPVNVSLVRKIKALAMESLRFCVGSDSLDMAKSEGVEPLVGGRFRVAVAYDQVGADLRGRKGEKAWRDALWFPPINQVDVYAVLDGLV